jgi:TPR repeat protein
MEYTDGMIQVDNCYLQGIGVGKDEHQVFTWHKKLADKGDYNGIDYFGYCYEHGISVEKDVNKAFAHY